MPRTAAKKPPPTRDRFVEMTAKLMSRRGYAAVGLNEIVEKSGAPKGSLYHHFPDGKEQLAAAAVEWATEAFTATLTAEIGRARSAADAVQALAAKLAGWMEASSFRDGSPITIVAVETGAFVEPLRLACQTGYQQWADILAAALQREGKPAREAGDLALWAVASLEGAIILSRVRKSPEPLRRIGRLLHRSFQ